jgi:hypothetical protein
MVLNQVQSKNNYILTIDDAEDAKDAKGAKSIEITNPIINNDADTTDSILFMRVIIFSLL